MKKYIRIFKYLGEYKGEIGLYTLFTILSIVFSIVSIGMLIPFFNLIFNTDAGPNINFSTNPVLNAIQSSIVNIKESRGKEFALGVICIIIIVFILLKNVFLVLSIYVLNPLKNKVVTRLRNDLFEKILHLPIGYFTEKRKGDLISRITNDISEVEGSVVGAVEGWVRDPLTIILNFAFLFMISAKLTVFLIFFIPVVGLIIGRITRSLKTQSLEVAHKQADSLSVLDETLNGLRVIKAFNVEGLIRNRFFTINQQLLTAKNKIGYKRDIASPMSEFMGVVVFCCILYFGGRIVITGGIMPAAAFIGYLGLFYNIINPAKSLSTSFGNMQKGTAAIARIEEVLQTANTVDDNANGKQLKELKESIELRNVSFAYDGVPILKNINLIVEKGKTIALVGSSGAGKSTLADLVPRFHDVTGGELLIDGVNIKEYSLKSVREQISIVTQEPILFNDSIENNIRIGKQGATDEELIAATRIANAYDFIIKKEGGLKSNIGDRGSKLSGGERQRMTIARAIVKNPPILILDEATSSLDTESERLVQDAINNMMQNRTSIVIAHRLSTIRHAHEIVVLQKGQIVDRGTHEELMEEKGYYYRLVQMQEVR